MKNQTPDRRPLEHRPIHDLLPYARNSRKHEDWQVAKIAASIKEFGFTNPVLIDTEGTIIAGHARVMAALKLDMESVPCIVLSDLSPTQLKAYVIADNQLATLSSWDDDMLKLELDELTLEGFDVKLLGFEDGAWKSDLDANTKVGGIDPNLDGILTTIRVICKQEDKEKTVAAIREALAEMDGVKIE